MYVHVSTKETTYGPGMIPTIPGFVYIPTYSQTSLVSNLHNPTLHGTEIRCQITEVVGLSSAS